MRERNILKPQEVTAVTLGIGEEAVVNTKRVSCAVRVCGSHQVFCYPKVRKHQRVKRMYSGSMRITNQAFINAYENSSTPEFKALAKQVISQVRMPPTSVCQHYFHFSFHFIFYDFASISFQLKVVYSKSPQLSKYYRESTVQAFRYAQEV